LSTPASWSHFICRTIADNAGSDRRRWLPERDSFSPADRVRADQHALARGRAKTDSNQRAANLFRDVNRDLVDGFLQQCGLDSVAHYHKAIELSRRYASQHLTRSLDVLHVAAACLLETPSFASLDARQRKLAASVGLTLLPATVSPLCAA
jgi:hypothetical protein